MKVIFIKYLFFCQDSIGTVLNFDNHACSEGFLISKTFTEFAICYYCLRTGVDTLMNSLNHSLISYSSNVVFSSRYVTSPFNNVGITHIEILKIYV